MTRALVTTNTRIVNGYDNRSLYVGDIVEGDDAREVIATGAGEALADLPASAAPQASESPAEDAAEVAATQAAIDHAEALGIDISSIQGSGKGGKVLKSDVEAAVAAKEGE